MRSARYTLWTHVPVQNVGSHPTLRAPEIRCTELRNACPLRRMEGCETRQDWHELFGCPDSLATEQLLVGLPPIQVLAEYVTFGRKSRVIMTVRRSPDIYTFPECDVAFDGRCCIRGLGVIPCCVFIKFSVDDYRIVICKALPWAPASRRARPKILRVDRLGREVVVTFDDNGLIRFRDYCSVPCCNCHLSFLSMLSVWADIRTFDRNDRHLMDRIGAASSWSEQFSSPGSLALLNCGFGRKIEQIPIGHLVGAADYLDHFGVGSGIAIRWVRQAATGLAGSRRHDIWAAPHQLLSQTASLWPSLGFLSEKLEIFAISGALELITMNEAQRRGVYAVAQTSHIPRSTRKQMA